MNNIKPGDVCLIINSTSGPNGPSVGRKVKVLNDRLTSQADADYVKQCLEQGLDLPKSPYDLPHSTLGKIWPVVALDGSQFVSEYGGAGHSIDVPEIWLSKILPPIENNVTSTSDELVHTS